MEKGESEMKPRAKKGFTLVELMVVAVIVAILAAVAIPLMTGNKRRAMATEAEAALGSVRTALRAMYAETKAYNRTPNGTTLSAGQYCYEIPGVSPEDLQGKYFVSNDYTIVSISANGYQIRATGSQGDAVGIQITLDQDGNWTRQGL
jgi:prepilin-type N-terminal cleavage/methylation domain-containing protein